MNTRQAAKRAGITYRKLDYWINQGIIDPSKEYGQGKARELSEEDLLVIKIGVILRGLGVSMKKIKPATRLILKTVRANRIIAEKPGEIIITYYDPEAEAR